MGPKQPSVTSVLRREPAGAEQRTPTEESDRKAVSRLGASESEVIRAWPLEQQSMQRRSAVPTCSQLFETTESCGEERSRGARTSTVAEVAGLAQSDHVNLVKCISALSEAKRGVVARGKRLKVESRSAVRAPAAGRPYAVRCPRSLAQRWHRRTRASRTRRLTRASL